MTGAEAEVELARRIADRVLARTQTSMLSDHIIVRDIVLAAIQEMKAELATTRGTEPSRSRYQPGAWTGD